MKNKVLSSYQLKEQTKCYFSPFYLMATIFNFIFLTKIVLGFVIKENNY